MAYLHMYTKQHFSVVWGREWGRGQNSIWVVTLLHQRFIDGPTTPPEGSTASPGVPGVLPSCSPVGILPIHPKPVAASLSSL